MLFLKLLVPILIGILSILQICIDFFWYDKKTKKHKIIRSLLPYLVILMTVITAIIVISDNTSSEKLETELKQLTKNSELSIELANKRETEAIKEIGELKELLKPFVEIADRNYPNMDKNLALNKLADELETVKEIATKDIFKPYSENNKSLLVKQLKTIFNRYPESPIIKFYIQQGTSNNNKVLKDLTSLLTQAGFSTETKLGFYPRTNLEYAWEIHTLSKNAKLIIEIFDSIKSYINPHYGIAFRDDEKWIKEQGEFPDGEIDIFIYESPNFNNDGQITY